MIPNFKSLHNWLTLSRQFRSWPWADDRKLPLQRPNLAYLARHPEQLPPLVAEYAVAQKYLTLLGPLAWDQFPERDPQHPWPGSAPWPRAPFVAAFLVKLQEQKRYMADLRTYLLEHPALIWLLGFELVPSEVFAYGFDPEASLPNTRLFLTVLRTLDNAALQFLLDSTVDLIRQELPPELNFGQTVAIDTKHILAWVKENNPKTFIKEGRYDKTRQPAADADCRLGVKKRRNQKTS